MRQPLSRRHCALASGLITLITCCAQQVIASDCSQVSVGLIPINDLGKGLYLGQFEGGLYPDGLNSPPVSHHDAGLTAASRITPLDPLGNPDPNGAMVLLSIGMSNANREFCKRGGVPPCNAWSFTGQALAHPDINKAGLAIANGAKGGQTSAKWDSPQDPNYDRVRDEVLLPMALTEAQVQAVWLKQARPGPDTSLPDPDSDAFTLMKELGDIVRAVKVRYPNIQQVFFSSRIYAGYASNLLNPEPYAYESGFAVKWLIEAQIRQRDGASADPVAGDLGEDTAPWLGWSAYLWADGETARSDGTSWSCGDLDTDGTHPAPDGEEKVGRLLLDFFLESPYSQPWFTAASAPPIAEGNPGELVLSPASISPGESLDITVTDPDINSDTDTIETTTATVINTGSNENETVLLEETAINTGIFRGTLTTLDQATPGVNDDSIMHVQANDVLVASYVDAEDGSGSVTTITAQSSVSGTGTSDGGTNDNRVNENTGDDAVTNGSTVDSSGGGGGGCTLRRNSLFDPVLLLMPFLVAAPGWLRRNRNA